MLTLDIGLSIDSGLHIKRIEPGSAAAEEETLSIGDKILTVSIATFIIFDESSRAVCMMYLTYY